MSKNTRAKLAIQRETILNLTTVIGGAQGAGNQKLGHTEVWCETNQSRSCPNTHETKGCIDQGPAQRWPQLTSPQKRYQTILQAHSQSYCVSNRPLSGCTLPPTAVD